MGIEIRIARSEDLDTVVGFSYALFQEDAGQRDPFTNLNWAKEEGHDYFRPMLTDPTHLVLVAIVENKPVGFLVGYLKNKYSVRPIDTAELHSMFVDKPYRGQKVGAALVEALLTWAKENGAERLSVSAYASNEGAIRFYKSFGFRPKNLSLEVGL